MHWVGYVETSGVQFPEEQLSVALLKCWYHRWLGNIHEWAGQERTVNISKGGFMFVPSAQLPKLLSEFNTKYLVHYTPCSGMNEEQLITAIAITHVELILIQRGKRTLITTVSHWQQCIAHRCTFGWLFITSSK